MDRKKILFILLLAVYVACAVWVYRHWFDWPREIEVREIEEDCECGAE